MLGSVQVLPNMLVLFLFQLWKLFYLIFILIVNYDSINISLQKVLFKTNFNSYITRSQQDSL